MDRATSAQGAARVRPLRDAAVRAELGISRTVAAMLAGVNRATLALYESHPETVRDDEKREQIAEMYGMLRELLANAPGMRPAGGKRARAAAARRSVGAT